MDGQTRKDRRAAGRAEKQTDGRQTTFYRHTELHEI